MRVYRKGIGSNYCTHGDDIFKNRPVSIFDIETKERTDFNSVGDCAKYFNARHSTIVSTITRKTRRIHNGKKYAIRYQSSLKPTNMTKAEQLAVDKAREAYPDGYTSGHQSAFVTGYNLRDQEVTEGLYTKKETVFFADHVLREAPQDIFADDKSSLLEIDKLHKEYFQNEQPDICTLISQRFTSSDMVKFAEWAHKAAVRIIGTTPQEWEIGSTTYTTTDLLKIFNELNKGE